MRRMTVLSGLLLAGALVVPVTASAAEDDDGGHRWIAIEDQFTIVLPNGDTFTDENPPPDEQAEPPTGARIFLGEALYATDDGETRGDEVGRTTIECTAQAIASTLFLSEASIEKHITSIFQKLGLEADERGNRRVLAALAHIESNGGTQ